MGHLSTHPLARLVVGLCLALATLATAGCSASFCVGSGCDKGTISFGQSFKQNGSSSIDVVNKTDTFRLGRQVAMVAKLSENAGTHSLTLEVSGNGKTRTFPYSVKQTDSNELATTFTPANLLVLGITRKGDYTIRLLHGSKELAKGTFTVK